MRGLGFIGLLLLPAAMLAVLAADVAWPGLRAAGERAGRWPPLVRTRARIGRLPVYFALPLFLIPELCSRGGLVASAWLVLQGHAWRGVAVYVASKVVAGTLALWLGSACLPVLLRVPAFASVYGSLVRMRADGAGWLRRRSGGRFAAAMSRVRAGRIRAGS